MADTLIGPGVLRARGRIGLNSAARIKGSGKVIEAPAVTTLNDDIFDLPLIDVLGNRLAALAAKIRRIAFPHKERFWGRTAHP